MAVHCMKTKRDARKRGIFVQALFSRSISSGRQHTPCSYAMCLTRQPESHKWVSPPFLLREMSSAVPSLLVGRTHDSVIHLLLTSILYCLTCKLGLEVGVFTQGSVWRIRTKAFFVDSSVRLRCIHCHNIVSRTISAIRLHKKLPCYRS